MKVGRRMQKKLFTIEKAESVEEAQVMMVVNNIRHLPVLEDGRLVGILSDRDIRGVMIPHNASGSGKGKGAFYLPPEATVEEAMSGDPLCVTPDTDLEEAARMLYSNKIGSLPVVEKGRVLGIITETDILWVFMEIMGVLDSSSRIDVSLKDDQKVLKEVTEIINNLGGEIISIGMSPDSKNTEKIFHFRLKSCATKPIVKGLKKAGFKILDEMG